MKKMMWFFAILPVLVTSIVLPLMPDTIPMHHDLAGNIDRWGSKTECFVFPVIILFITLFWHLLMRAFEKKAEKGKWRISESTLFTLVLLGGGIGGIAGMYLFRHKTKKIKFIIRKRNY